jgi:hypothetical protein
MTTFTNSPKLIKGGIVLVDPDSYKVLQVISLQYNPESLSRSYQIQGVEGSGGGDRSQALRLKGPPVETLTLEAEIDATDKLEEVDPVATETGIHPILAALEMIIHPSSADLLANNVLARSGTLEIIPMESPLTLFVWSKNRILPVRLTELSITEEAFDPTLNPIRAKVSLGMRVFNVDDLGFDHKGGSLFMNYLQAKENLSKKFSSAELDTLGIGEIP